jgi:holliday junction DNA helicase RuvA
MIAHLRGTLFSKSPTAIILEVGTPTGAVGYGVTITVPTFSALPAPGAPVSLHIHTEVREDALALFGFLHLKEKQLFERLTAVSGIGPSLAMKILSGLPTDELVGAIRAADHARLVRIPGVGKRLAERLVVELKGKLEDFAASASPTADAPLPAGPATEDVLSALVNLGYGRPAAQKAIESAIRQDAAAAEDFDTLFRATLPLVR